MSEQRRMRAELRQGLHQFLMQLHFSYSESMDKAEVQRCLSEVIKEEHEYFTGIALNDSSVLVDTLTMLLTEYQEKARTTNDQYEELTLYSKVEAIDRVLDILREERGSE